MSKKLRIIPYGVSDSVSSIVNYLRSNGADVRKIKLLGSEYNGHPDHIILNWGSHSRRSVKLSYKIFNEPEAVMVASDKVSTFIALRDAGLTNNIPKFTTDIEEAKLWVSSGITVYCRTLTRASQGRGIVVARTVEEVVEAPLYSGKCPRNREIRIHVFSGQVIDFAQKKKMSEERMEEDGITYSNDVRSHGNGWVFARDGVQIPDSAKEVAIKAVAALGLDFGAVDMALSLNSPKVFEVNTAPGLEGTTLERYCEKIKELLA